MRTLRFFVERWTLNVERSLCLLLALVLSLVTSAETLPELAIIAPRVTPARDSAAVAPDSPGAQLALVPGVTLQSQGPATAQSDLRIRGSAFSAAGVAVNGLSLRTPQTEHFNAEMPLPASLFQAPERMTGAEQFLRSGGNPSGTVGFEFAPITATTRVQTGVGESGRNWQALQWQAPLVQTPQTGEIGAGVFAGRETANATDGHGDNDLDRWNGGLHLQQLTADTQSDFAAGVQDKTFGARGFYGAPARFPSEEHLTDRLILGSSRFTLNDDSYIRAGAAWRELLDRYWLDGTRPELYENRHRSRQFTTSLDGHTALDDSWALNWRADADLEDINSRYTGTFPGAGLGQHHRRALSLTLAPEWHGDRLRLYAGGRAAFQTGDAPALLPLAGAEWELVPGQSLFLDYAEAARQPSFTELNYNSPGSLGNQGLQTQHTRSLEGGWKGRADAYGWKLALFGEQSRNTVDWIRTNPAATQWLAADLGQVDTLGLEAFADWRPGPGWTLDASYTVLHKDAARDAYASRYILDYPEQDVAVGLRRELAAWCEFRIRQGLRYQVDNPARGSSRIALPATASLSFRPLRNPQTRFDIGVENLWNSNFEEFPGQPPAGQRFCASLSMAW